MKITRTIIPSTLLVLILVGQALSLIINSDTAGSRIQVRLSNASQDANGRYIYGVLELSEDGSTWGYPCQEAINKAAGTVICSMFNYTRAEVIAKRHLGRSNSSFAFPSAFDCAGTESSLDACNIPSSSSRCTNGLGIMCYNNSEEVHDMRIANTKESPTYIEGRLEVRLIPVFNWGTVCDDSFTDTTATAACKNLDYKFGEAVAQTGWDLWYTSSAPYGSGEQTLLDEVFCERGQAFFDCSYDPWGAHDCSPSEDVGVICYNATVRMMSAVPEDHHIGTVELYLESAGGWHEVCDPEWDDNDAKVVCREIGYKDGKALNRNSLGAISYGSISAVGSVTNVSCDGSEENLSDCKMEQTNLCNFHGAMIDLAAVICYDTPMSEVDMSIATRVTGSANPPFLVGVLEVRQYGIWGRVCEDRDIFPHPPVSDKEASVACRMQGFSGGKRIGSLADEHEEKEHHIWLRGFNCIGNETSIDKCMLPPWGSPGFNDCDSPVRVACYKQELELHWEKKTEWSGVVSFVHDDETLDICADSWTDAEANAACIEVGYSSGRVWTGESGNDIKTSRVVGNISCADSTSNFFSCVRDSWGNPASYCKTGHAGIACYKEVKLDPGTGSAGIVQIFDRTLQQYNTICRNEFDDTDAEVICREVGFSYGSALPYAAFGQYTSRHGRFNVNCLGTESSIMNCSYNTNATGCSSASNYASVSCYNSTSTGTFRLQGGKQDSSEAWGVIQIYQNNTWGYICEDVFTDHDGEVFCNELGRATGNSYHYGVKLSPLEKITGPYLITNPNCTKGLDKLSECSLSPYICSKQMAARILCSSNSAPRVELETDLNVIHSGKVMININGQTGPVCADDWDEVDATVLCKQMNPNFRTGLVKLFDRTEQPFLLSGMKCSGRELSLFHCKNDGWRSPDPTTCNSTSKEAGVICYTNVVLRNERLETNSISGSLSVMVYSGRLMDVCFDYSFTHHEAQLVCSELGYNYAALLSPSHSDRLDYYYMMKRFRCDENDKTLGECRYSTGSCYEGQVRILCYTNSVNSVNSWEIEHGQYGQLSTNIGSGYIGVICPVNFETDDATTVCSHKSSMDYGQVLASPEFPNTTKEYVWFGPPSCSPLCTFSQNVSETCFTKTFSAGVLCHEEDMFGIRLMERQHVGSMVGRVEINYNNVWGTVCAKNISPNQKWLLARTVCLELGFWDATALSSTSNRFGISTGPIYLKDVVCTGKTDLLGCSNAGWGEASNCTHEDDLEVRCHDKERLYPDPEKSYGAVSVYTEGSYSLACADNFTEVDATVFCSGLGYTGGIPICCSALEVPEKGIRIMDVRCAGTEKSLLECFHYKIDHDSFCNSGTYATVACSVRPSNERPIIRIEPTGSKRIIIDYYGAQGIVCNNYFTKEDATVACRSQGYHTGLAFESIDMTDVSLPWAGNLRCKGNESGIEQCPNFRLGRTGRCRTASSVVCLRETDNPELQVRLVNGTNSNNGILEVQIDATWGSVCNLEESSVGQTEATVLCKQLGFSDGKVTPSGLYGASKGPVWLQDLNCPRRSSKLSDCRPRLMTQDRHVCKSHFYDLTLECFSTVKLVNGPQDDRSRGILQIQNTATGAWEYVCDNGITDKEATIVCKSLGFQYGKQQCCNAAGEVTDINNLIAAINCSSATDIKGCAIDMSRTCPSQQYSYVHCSATEFQDENLMTRRMDKFIGKPMVTRYGIEGRICATGLTDKEASVMCRELGYASGFMLPLTSTDSNSPIMLKNLSCSGLESSIKDCTHTALNDGTKCSNQMSAQILCKRRNGVITYKIFPDVHEASGTAGVVIDGETFYIDNFDITEATASVFCKSIPTKSYVFGRIVYRRTPGTVQGSSILMTSVKCTGKEKSIFDCPAEFLPQFSQIGLSRRVHFECHAGVELEQGTTPSSGILTLYNPNIEAFGNVCNGGFGETEAGVACRMLGHEHGQSHCCLPFGYSYKNTVFKDFKCTGTEKSLLDCEHTAQEGTARLYCSGDSSYVGITCYNGTKPNDFTISLGSAGASNIGMLQVNYLNTSGTVCSDSWNDRNAKIACRELGFFDGLAYQHYRPFFSFEADSGPFWLSNVQCTGEENRLADCPHSGLGNVSSCEKGHFAGVLCTNGQEILYRLTGTEQSNYGRVEVQIDGTWGSVCDRYWDYRDASVMCRQLGFATGDVFDTLALDTGTGPVWEINPRCSGDEENMNHCAHEGWKAAVSGSCTTHSRDAGVFCYNHVRLGTGSGKTIPHGPVQYYQDGDWYMVCDDGFNDLSARRVCEELGFYDGRALCCSAYSGETASYETLHPNITMSCSIDDGLLRECISQEDCKSDNYASVVCFERDEKINETDYTFTMNEDFSGAGRLEVTHLGVQGRICSAGWTDDDARVYCKSIGVENGFSYHHSYAESYVTAKVVGPYWISDVHCFGNESSLNECKFNERLDIGNCSTAHTAAAVCFSDNGVQYRLAGMINNLTNAGRIEMAIDNKWGTVCDRTWDNKDARVACKSLDFTDGEVEKAGKYGRGTGPLWLRDVQCEGDESALHKCPHTGFQDEEVVGESSFPWFVSPCSDHTQDATVFCFKDAKLNQNLGTSSGGLLYNKDDKWVHICDSDSFTNAEAKVACGSLLQGFVDGVPIHGGVFGDMENDFGVSSIQCTESEDTLSSCQVVSATECSSGEYVSVACFDQALQPDDFNFQIRLSNDTFRTSDNHGILEVRQNGAWGRICMHNFNKKAATVACKQLGYNDGVSYLHLFRNRLPILWNKVVCSGSETSLAQCQHDRIADKKNCNYNSNDAGVLCYNGEGVHYRLTGGQDKSSGRVEIGIDGDYGTVCSSNWNHNNSRVLCRYLGYADGIPMHERNDSLEYMKTLMSFFLCNGDEPDLLHCFNSGFDEGKNVYYCQDDSYTACYDEHINITDIRLGDNATDSGRVEIYVSGLHEWGTICDDQWDDLDARVVCRSLGFDDGVSTANVGHRSGTGRILLDNVECIGTESSLEECRHHGVHTHNCDHSEDAGVRCFNEPPIVPTVKPATTKEPITTRTTKQPDTTTTKKPDVTTKRVTPATTTTTKKPEITTKRPTPSPKPKVTTTESKPTTKTTVKPFVTPSTTKKPSPSSSVGPAKTEQASANEGKKTKVIVAACVTIVLAIVLIALVVFVILRHRTRSKAGVPHERFHDDFANGSHDGSVAVANRMFDMTNTEGSDPMADGSEIHLDRGFVKFSKGSPPPPEGADSNGNAQEGFSNPLYSAMKNASEVGDDEIHFDDSDTATISVT